MDSVGISLLLPFLILFFISSKIGLFLLFKKAQLKNPWQAFIPIWDWFVLAKFVGKPWWYGITIQIPVIGVVTWYTLSIELIKGFGRFKLWEHILGLLLQFVYWPFLGLNKKVEYLGQPNSEEFKNKYVPKTRTMYREWSDAILFAVVVAYIIRTFFVEAYKIPTPSMEKSLLVGDFLFVSKVHYGSRIPMTPLAIPFAHQDIAGVKIYSELLKLPYMRLPALEKLKRYTPVVFNNPNENNHPVDKKTHYIKRCVGVAGDSLQVINGYVYINGKKSDQEKNIQFMHEVTFKNYELSETTLVDELDLFDYLKHSDLTGLMRNTAVFLPGKEYFSASKLKYDMPLSQDKVAQLKQFVDLDSIEILNQPKGYISPDVYPQKPDLFAWNRDNYGPIYIPKKGDKIELNQKNFYLYKKVIEEYEGNKDVWFDGSKAIINGEAASHYTFKMNYYWMMGDNRHNSEDSRYWGFVPEDHIVGKPLFIWFSIKNKNAFDPINRTFKESFHSVRWNRIMKKAY